MGLIHRLTDILSSNVNELLKSTKSQVAPEQASRTDDAIRAALKDAAKVVAHEHSGSGTFG